MSKVTVTLKDGNSIEFAETGRPGGSYSNSVAYEIGFVVVTDEWGAQVAFPASDIAKVTIDAYRRW